MFIALAWITIGWLPLGDPASDRDCRYLEFSPTCSACLGHQLVFVAIEESEDFPLRDFFLAENLGERDEEKDDTNELKALDTPLILSSSSLSLVRNGAHRPGGAAPSQDASLPRIRTVLIRC
jgi:hypothetical protein